MRKNKNKIHKKVEKIDFHGKPKNGHLKISFCL